MRLKKKPGRDIQDHAWTKSACAKGNEATNTADDRKAGMEAVHDNFIRKTNQLLIN